jgi:hypothetical protein
MNYTGIFGFDISTWQDSPSIPGVIDFQAMRDYGGRFVIIKAGQGNWKDPDFDVSWKNAKGILPRATYWFYDNRYPPKEQAEKYFEIIKGDLEGMCWLDLEDRQVGIYSGWRGWYDFIVALKDRRTDRHLFKLLLHCGNVQFRHTGTAGVFRQVSPVACQLRRGPVQTGLLTSAYPLAVAGIPDASDRHACNWAGSRG